MATSKIKAVFFDIDGTLLSHTAGYVPHSTVMALEQLHRKNIKLFAATGRHMLELKALPLGCLPPFDGYLTLNGQLCLDGKNHLFLDAAIPAEDVENMLPIISKHELPVMIVEKERMYINFVNDAVCAAQREISTPVPEIGVYQGNSVYQFIVYDDGSRIKSIINQLPNCKISRWNPNAVDILPKKGGKIAGIVRCLEYFHINRSEIMAFGDGENDIDMLRYAKIGVAMGNADIAVKKSADHVTADIDDDGILEALQYYSIL